MRLRLRREARWIGVIALIVVIALACGLYLLSNERIASPFSASYEVSAVFPDVAAVAPGLGEPVNVAGVRVGQVSGVDLVGGRGVLHMRIDPGKLPHLYAGARATLVPNTPLKDMQVDLAPGRRGAAVLPDGATIPVADTTSPINSDELTHALDTDTREYFRLLISDVGIGLKGRGPDLRAVLRSLGPTTAQLHRISSLLASRRRTLPLLVHNLSVLTVAVGSRDGDLGRIIGAGNATLGAIASQDAALRDALTQLPDTLALAHRTLVHASPFARSLRRTLTAIEPAVPRLKATLDATPDTVRGLLGLPIGPLKRFTAAAGPLSADVRSAASDLGSANPSLKKAFKTIDATTNVLAYNANDGSKGYLFWLAWFAHNANSMISTEDANGAVWRGLGLFSCDSLAQSGAVGQPLTLLLKNASGCP